MPATSTYLISHRNLTLIGSNALFLGIAATLLLAPQSSVAVYPVFILVFFWTDLRRDEEMHVIFLFMAAAAGLLLISRAAGTAERAALAVETAGVWAASLGLGLHRGRMSAERHRILARVKTAHEELQGLERDVRFYDSFDSNVSTQVRLRRDLTEAAKSIGTTMDPREVQMRLIGALEARYPGSRVHILPGQPSDPLTAWAARTGASVLVRDVRSDDRFRAAAGSAFRSAVAAAVLVMKRPHGFLRLENDQPDAYSQNDLRTVDLFATLAALALENIGFFESVNDLATHDALTQLFTHRAFETRLQEEILRSARSQTPLSLIMCDVDHFKRYNDSYGHQAGDMVLQQVAAQLANHARPVDFVARYGGEEFALILPSIVRSQAVDLANRIRVKTAEEPFLFQGQRTRVTLSFGVASFPQDATTTSQLVRAADERLYRAKSAGRNQVVG